MRRRLTDQMLQKIKPSPSTRLEVLDTLVPGLTVRVTPRGVKSFSVIYKVPGEGGVSSAGRLVAGRQHRITLGRYPILTLNKAREQARRLLEKVGEGQDPRVERAQQNLLRHANTVEAVARRFLEQDARRTVASWRKIDRVLELHVLPAIGTKPIRDVRRSDIHAVLDGIVASGRVGVAREVRKHLSRLFNWAVDRELVNDNPVHGMNRRDLAPSADVGRALSDEEMRALWSAADAMGYPFGSLYQLLLMTGQRRNEWAQARWVEIDAERRVLEVPASRYKGRRDHVVPLGDAVWTILEGFPRWIDSNSYILSTRSGEVPVQGFSQGKRALDTGMRDILGSKFAPFRVHDLRVTCETRLANLGFIQDVRDAVLGHAKPGLQRTYNKHDYQTEKRDALEQYARQILEIVR